MTDQERRRRGGRMLVVVATYNERENLPGLTESIFQAVPEATLLVIDDSSPDGTGEWASQHAIHERRLRVMHRARKLGLGSAILEAMRIAIRDDFDLLLNLDADFSHDPAAIPAIVRAIDGTDLQHGADVVIGSRYVSGGATVGWSWRRRWMSRAVNALARRSLRLPVRDCSSGFRCFRMSLLKRLDLTSLRATGYAFHEESLWRLKRVGAHIVETPITFVNRRRGKSKINGREAATAILSILRWGWIDRFCPAGEAHFEESVH